MSTISDLSSTTNPYQTTNQNGFAQSIQNLQAIGTALQSGDLATAQSELTAFQQGLPGNSQTSSSQPFGKNSQANSDYQNLVSALQSGNTANAQKAFSSLQTDLKSVHKGHHHHHSSSATSATAQSQLLTTPSSTSTNTSSTSSDSDNDGSVLNVTA